MAGLSRRDVLRISKEKDVKFIRLWFTDILGFLKSFAITIRELERALEDGMGFDRSSMKNDVYASFMAKPIFGVNGRLYKGVK